MPLSQTFFFRFKPFSTAKQEERVMGALLWEYINLATDMAFQKKAVKYIQQRIPRVLIVVQFNNALIVLLIVKDHIVGRRELSHAGMSANMDMS